MHRLALLHLAERHDGRALHGPYPLGAEAEELTARLDALSESCEVWHPTHFL
jgi:hypothetical protein